MARLTLSGSAPALAALRRAPPFADADGVWRRTTRVRFDTHDGALAACGFRLERLVRAGGDIQRIAPTGPGGAGRGGPIETPIPPGAPFPVRSGHFHYDWPVANLRDKLDEQERSGTDEWTTEILISDARVSCRFCFMSRGQQSNATSALHLSAPVSHAKVLSTFAKRLMRAAPALRIIYCHDTDENVLATPPRKVKIQVTSEETADVALQQGLRQLSLQIAAFQAPILVDRDGEALRRMRVALRRLRVLCRTFGPYCPDLRLRRLERKAKAIARSLGPARDWDVFLKDTLPRASSWGYLARGFSELRRAAEARQAEAWQDAFLSIAGVDFSEFIIALDFTAAKVKIDGGRAEPWPAASDFAPDALDKALQRAVRVAARVDPDIPETRHKLRIALKKLRYTAQTFNALYEKSVRKPYMASLSGLQETFGTFNDACVAQSLVDLASEGQGPDAARAAGFTAGLYGRQGEDAVALLDDQWRAFIARSPYWRSAP